jgi:pyruvate/2-oxoglutarate dehydrogenase complex dihydrolipoamide dehydrogenase (E3) component
MLSERHAKHYDLIVIGGGASGSSVASGAVEEGLSVALIEEWKLGGTCLNAGCDPTKTMVRSAEVLHLARTAHRFGISVPDAAIDWTALRARVDQVIDEIRGGDGPANVRAQGIALYESHAKFISEHEILAGDTLLSADRFVIATGQTEHVAPIDGIRTTGFLTNVEAVVLDDLPESLVIVGGGVVAVEFAQMFARFGTDVTLVGTQEYVLPKEDEDLRRELTDVLRDEGITLEMNARADKAERMVDGRVRLTCSRKNGPDVEVVADEILMATGRKPNMDRLDLDAAGVRYGERGITVDAWMTTNVPHIYAVGDVTGIYPFTHVADYQARIALHNILHDDERKRADYRVVPWSIFTDPELARVGLTEAEARAGGYSVVTATTPFENLPRAMTSDQREGLVKLVVDRATHQVLGGHILGAGAGELISEIAIVMQHRLPVSALSETIHPYPTMSEAIFWTAHDLVTGPLAGTTSVLVR